MRFVYPCNIVLDEEERQETGREAYNVTFPDLPEAITCGWSWEEAVEMAEDVLWLCISDYCTEQGYIPTPSPPTDSQIMISVPPLAAAKLAINAAMKEHGISRKALAERLGFTEEATRKLLDPLYRTHLSQLEKALKVVGRSLVVEDVPIVKPAMSPVVG